MSQASIARSVVRFHLASIVGISIAFVCVSIASTTFVVVHREDLQARAQALTLAAELSDHNHESEQSLSELVHHELGEQHAFGRRIEVWRNGRFLSYRGAAGRLRPFTEQSGCVITRVEGVSARVCTTHAVLNTSIVVASPLRPILLAQLPILAAIAMSGLGAALIFLIVGRHGVRKSLAPLRDFERTLAEFPAATARQVPVHWNASEIDQLATTFNALLERLRAALEHEQRFVANAAHELRTPVTRLRGQIELVLQDQLLSEEATQRLSLAAKSCMELGRSLEAVLALAHDDVAPLETVDLADIVMEVVEGLTAVERVRVTADDASATVRGDPILLTLATRNLVDNALKYSEGEVALQIREVEGTCWLTVRDHGHGIPEEELLQVREAFVRGSQSTRIRGSGLGLALVEHVVKQHRGRLVLTNLAPRSGLQASIVLPKWISESSS